MIVKEWKEPIYYIGAVNPDPGIDLDQPMTAPTSETHRIELVKFGFADSGTWAFSHYAVRKTVDGRLTQEKLFPTGKAAKSWLVHMGYSWPPE